MNPAPSLRVLTHRDTDLHAAYCDYVAQVFTQADFRRWCEWGQWSGDYLAFCLFQDGRVVANASAMRMRLVIEGAQVDGWQFGAVGCLPELRGRGLARAAMQAALAHCGDAPILLFANERVLDFYPRFGFAPAPQSLFALDWLAHPGPTQAPVLDLAEPSVRAAFLRAAASARPVSQRFGARDYGRTATWYAANGYASPLHRLDEDVWVFAQTEDAVLTIEDVFAAAPVDWPAAIGRLIDQPIRELRFGFTPQRDWPRARVLGEEADAGLFVRNLATGPLPSRFPLLART
ncbi:acetyltransferase family protein [Lysobacter capsici]|uniref:GNAT family N-acetyltransferase n=1 Tax=Lysobacter capsici TaxID=435897 RepID=UPI0007165098|nr:GNAT family N-acetyltransferase [Lysobacter capsici]ALN85371.1 acetyltransferase family protein [Lysobacter capsici]